MIIFDRWEVSQLQLDVPTLSKLWVELQKCPTLFSDATRSDIRNWISLVQDPNVVWYVVKEKGMDVGVIYFLLQGDDADVHVAFFDRKPAEKKALMRHIAKLLFDGISDLQRLSAAIPDIYHGTCRLAKSAGFQYEGTKRKAVVIGGQRRDVHLYALLREEAYGIS